MVLFARSYVSRSDQWQEQPAELALAILVGALESWKHDALRFLIETWRMDHSVNKRAWMGTVLAVSIIF